MALSTLEKVLFLRGVELFGEMDAEELVPLARLAQDVAFPAGEHFIVQGEVGDSLYIIVEGEVSIVLDGVGELMRRGPKSVIGEMAIISHSPRTAHCFAHTDITALKVTYDDFWELMDEQPKLARATIQVLTRRFEDALENLRRYRGDPRENPT